MIKPIANEQDQYRKFCTEQTGFLSSPSTAYELQSFNVSVVSCPESGCHAILIRGVQIFPCGFFQKIQIAIDGCFVISWHDCNSDLSSSASRCVLWSVTGPSLQASGALCLCVWGRRNSDLTSWNQHHYHCHKLKSRVSCYCLPSVLVCRDINRDNYLLFFEYKYFIVLIWSF